MAGDEVTQIAREPGPGRQQDVESLATVRSQRRQHPDLVREPQGRHVLDQVEPVASHGVWPGAPRDLTRGEGGHHQITGSEITASPVTSWARRSAPPATKASPAISLTTVLLRHGPSRFGIPGHTPREFMTPHAERAYGASGPIRRRHGGEQPVARLDVPRRHPSWIRCSASSPKWATQSIPSTSSRSPPPPSAMATRRMTWSFRVSTSHASSLPRASQPVRAPIPGRPPQPGGRPRGGQGLPGEGRSLLPTRRPSTGPRRGTSAPAR